MEIYEGIPAAPGIVSGPAYLFSVEDIEVPRVKIDDPAVEFARFESALSVAEKEIEDIRERAQTDVGTEEAAIFGAHALFMKDPELIKNTRSRIEENKINAEAAWMDAIKEMAAKLDAMEDEYFKARAIDVRDVGRRLLRILLGLPTKGTIIIEEPSIVIARDLTPSDTVRLERDMVLAFCTAEGGPTSHTAILAKALGFPAVVGTGKKILEISNGDFILVDGDLGEVIVNPDEDAQKDYEARRKLAHAQSRAELEVADEPAITTDGHHVEVVANVGNVADTESALNYGAEGIGLLRTEFIYLDREDAPDEDEQYKAYNDILGLMQDRPVVVRTIDVGGDKELPYLDLGEEANPFLGWRAIRMCLDRPDFFKIQLRALLRASPDHDLRIMFPMISTLEEVRCARSLLAEARDEVLKQGHDVAENIQIGIMVEIPSVVVMADQFAKEVDFFSIGTNDLTQYTMAAERVNEKLSGLNDPCHPAILRQIKRVIETAHDEGIWVGLCGEMAGDPIATPILLGLGLDEFSMAPISIPHIKAIIRCLDLESANQLAAEVVLMDSAEDVRKHVHQFQKSNLV